MRLSRSVCAGLLLAVVPELVGEARGDTCGPAGGLSYVLPVDGARDVSRAARVSVRFPLVDAPLEAPELSLTAGGGPVGGSILWDGLEIVFVPDEPLAPETELEARITRVGRDDHRWTFRTSGEVGVPVAPVLGPALEARARYLGGGPEDDDCGPVDLERYRVRLDLTAARGSSGAQNIEYLAFQTSGPGVDEPVERGRAVDESGAPEVHVELYLPADDVEGQACFRVLAADVTGLASGTTAEACARLAEGPFFQSLCTVIPGSRAGGPAAVAVVLCASVALVARRRVRTVRSRRPRGLP